MKVLVLLVICASAALAFPNTYVDAEKCTAAKCKIEKGCACASSSSPLGDKSITPQLVTLTFDDSLRADVYEDIKQLLFARKNPDGSPASATVYIPHKYTDYQKVNDLYNRGFDIGVNSISKDTADYFKTAPTELLVDEFDGQRKIISKFANIPLSDIGGVRTPHFELAADTSFSAYVKSDLKYDNSWTTRSDKPIYPYTLEYKSSQQCLVGGCPTQSYPGFWVVPIINFVGFDGQQCNVLWACQVNGTAANIRDWLIDQYERVHNSSGNRAPLSFLVNAAYFQIVENSREGLELFLDYLGKQKDTFLVSHKEVVRWATNPVPVDKYRPVVEAKSRSCSPATCQLAFKEEEIMYMGSCTQCPDVYPWVGNPEGNE